VGDDLGVAGIGGLAAEHDRGPRGPARISLSSASLDCSEALAGELGSEVGRPEALASDLVLERVNGPRAACPQGDKLEWGREVERLDLLRTNRSASPVF